MPLYAYPDTQGNWLKYGNNPVFGNKKTGTCFDVFLLPDIDSLRMYFSWRPKKSLAVTISSDGIHWEDPKIVLSPDLSTDWEDDLNRNCIVRANGLYHMWYTGQDKGYSCIGYATSTDGYKWNRYVQNPILKSELIWEGKSVMCPHVIWDEKEALFKMWYSGGETYEPNAIGYAVSTDGINWKKHPNNPVFTPIPGNLYEHERVAACQVIKQMDGYLMFYIGFEDIDTSRICVAKSPDGITQWKRSRHNPIISPTKNSWDSEGCYKPFAIYDEIKNCWMLYYNGRTRNKEYIGLATLEGTDLGF